MKAAALIAAQREERRSKGYCMECDTPRFKGYVLCQRHHELQRARAARYSQRRRDRSLCYCGRPRAPKRARCSDCLELEIAKGRLRRQERREQGLCRQCGQGEVVDGQTACRRCRKAQARRYHDRRIGQIRRRLRELITRGRIAMPARIRERARFLLGAMPVVEAPDVGHWRPIEAACRQYAREHPEWEGFLLVARPAPPNRPKGIARLMHYVYLLTRVQISARRQRIDLVHIPTSTDVPWRRYSG